MPVSGGYLDAAFCQEAPTTNAASATPPLFDFGNLLYTAFSFLNRFIMRQQKSLIRRQKGAAMYLFWLTTLAGFYLACQWAVQF